MGKALRCCLVVELMPSVGVVVVRQKSWLAAGPSPLDLEHCCSDLRRLSHHKAQLTHFAAGMWAVPLGVEVAERRKESKKSWQQFLRTAYFPPPIMYPIPPYVHCGHTVTHCRRTTASRREPSVGGWVVGGGGNRTFSQEAEKNALNFQF